jgi:NADP-dependent 3-hydroxy acid dehydrogenase YdfG
VIRVELGCAVVTGGSAGIGRALVLELAGKGMPVVVVGRSFDRAEVVAGEARALGVRALAVECDVSDPAAFQGLAVTVREEFGAVELLALNAGVTTAGPLVNHS